MGTVIDATDRVLSRRRPHEGRDLHALKYYVLAALLAASVFALQPVYLLDPLCLLTRTVTLAFVPPLQWAAKWLSDGAYTFSISSSPIISTPGIWLSDRLSGWEFASAQQIHYRQAIPVFLIFAVIVGLGRVSRRYWCRNLCPLGALLGLLSRFSPLHRFVGEGCTHCGKCLRECKMAAPASDPSATRRAECVACMSCVSGCPPSVTNFGFKKSATSLQPDLSRRRLLLSAGAGLVLAGAAGLDKRRAIKEPAASAGIPELLRPPGAVPEEKFTERCVRCGSCMKVCPTNGLQPSIHEAGLEGFWTPILVPRIGYCRENCNACGQVCATDAIRKVAVEEKKHIFIGRAEVQKDRCLAWRDGKACLVCAEYCSYHGVSGRKVNGVNVLVIDPEKCVGCGQCEFACPVKPAAAIRVRPLNRRKA
jgi:ferredoxin